MTDLVVQLILGAAIIVFATPLSRSYNAWTTKVRERQNRPPTPTQRAKNTRIFAWLLRFVGACLIFIATVGILATHH